jgi:hypothetical protein
VSWELRQALEGILIRGYLSNNCATNFVVFTKNKVKVLNAQSQAENGYPLWLVGSKILKLYFDNGPIAPLVVEWKRILTRDMIQRGAWYGGLRVGTDI